MMQPLLNLEQNELQDKYLQARDLVIRFINNDPNVVRDAYEWILSNKTLPHAEESRLHHQVQRSSNIVSLSLCENDEYPLVVEFKDGGKYAYDVRSVTYAFPDGTQETKTARQIFELLMREDDDAVNGRVDANGKMASVGHLFHHLIKRADNKAEPIKYKEVA